MHLWRESKSLLTLYENKQETTTRILAKVDNKMGWFSKKISLQKSGIFNGFTDWHSHILPGIDDGIKTLEDSLKVLEEFDKLGIDEVWLTPHVMEDFPNTTSSLKEKFESLKKAWQGKVRLNLASENMLDTLYEDRLMANDFLPIGHDSDHLLVETSYFTPPYAMDDMLDETRKRGYNIILAHPERYRYMGEKDYINLKERGIKFQMNLLSLTGGYGEEAQKKSEWLINKGMFDYLGTDIHRLDNFRHHIAREVISEKHLSKLHK